MKYFIFHNAADDSYMNVAHNFRGVDVEDQKIHIYFESPQDNAYDKITCVVTNGEEDRAVEQLAVAMSGGGPNPVVIIADDVNGIYACQDILSVSTITKATQATRINVEAFTPAGDGTGASDNANTKQLEASDSGKTFLINMATNTAAFRLPAVANNSGVNYGFIMDVTSDGEDTKDFILSTDANAENIMGVVQDAGAIHDIPPTTSVITLDASAGNVGAGDRLFCVCDGTNWYITEANALSANAWVPADNAI